MDNGKEMSAITGGQVQKSRDSSGSVTFSKTKYGMNNKRPTQLAHSATSPCRINMVYSTTTSGSSFRQEEDGSSHSFPFMAPIVNARYLTTSTSAKRVMQMTLDIEGSGIRYEPGDYLCIICPNAATQVDGILSRLNLEGVADKPFHLTRVEDVHESEGFPKHIQSPTTLRYALTHCCDITVAPSKKFLRMLGEYASGEDKEHLLHLTSSAGREDYIKFLNSHPSLLDILTNYVSCQPPVRHVIDLLPPLTPRDYSISSSQSLNINQVSLVFTVVDYVVEPVSGILPRKNVKGVCTNWMEQQAKYLLSQQEFCNTEFYAQSENNNLGITSARRIPLFFKASAFRLPTDTSCPLILVGPGSGVAPFLGFLQHKFYDLKHRRVPIGKIYLFFGCRNSATDYVATRDWLSQLEKEGIITKFICAFSRDNDDEVVHVQHKLLQFAEIVASVMLQESGHFYVCGDAKGMIQSVNAVLMKIIMQYSKQNTDNNTTLMLDEKIAQDIFSEWVKEARYLQDVWF